VHELLDGYYASLQAGEAVVGVLFGLRTAKWRRCLKLAAAVLKILIHRGCTSTLSSVGLTCSASVFPVVCLYMDVLV
jgi:hypothetical protein